MNQLPIEVLNRLLICDPDAGKLFWRARTPDLFPDVPLRRSVDACSSWNNTFAGREALASPNASGYLTGNIFKRGFRAHRVIWAMHFGAWPEAEIDHVNGDRADNRIANLRPATSLENKKNTKKSVANSSGRKGVYWHKGAGRWLAQIVSDGRHNYLGLFDDLEEAGAAYARASAELHGKFGRVA